MADHARPSPRSGRPTHLTVPDLGVGAGLRVPHYRHVLENEPSVGFFEIISENFMGPGGKPQKRLGEFIERFPIILHGVSLSIGAPEEPDRDYLRALKKLVRQVQPPWVSDHFCWCGTGGAHLHDLLPLAYTDEVIERIARRARQIQDYLEVPFGLENTSSYLTYRRSQYTEWEFIREVCERADCGLMFDVNNVFVSAYNHGFDPIEFVRNVPHERILQIHLAGHTNFGDYIIDTHVGPPLPEVLALYQETIRLCGPVSTLLEWDDRIPPFERLQEEVDKIFLAREEALTANYPALQSLTLRRKQPPTESSGGSGVQGEQGGAHQSDNELPHAEQLAAERTVK
ncbi:MAG: DUF692 domain-containing protein [Polyangiaceae bacterium]|nr:DUF692 domain-containing protein [Polyangiaceae bacterium]